MYQDQIVYGSLKILLQRLIHIQTPAGTYSGGIRSYTRPGTGTVEQTYVRCRKKGTTVERGELSKTYYDAQ